MVKKNTIRISVETKYPVAYASPDHLEPWGTKRDNSTNHHFNEKIYALYPSGCRILDIGCSGGGFVRSCIDDGFLAVGIEGSDYSKIHKRAEWRTIPDFLFTADATNQFDVFLTRKGKKERLLFEVVTCWEFIEHITEQDLARVAVNVKKHLAPGGLWIMSVSPNEEWINGTQLHQTVKPREWWIQKFFSVGFTHLEEYVSYFNTQFVRGEKYNAPGSFHLVLSQTPQKVPIIPKEPMTMRLLDRWIGSRFQRIIKKIITGD